MNAFSAYFSFRGCYPRVWWSFVVKHDTNHWFIERLPFTRGFQVSKYSRSTSGARRKVSWGPFIQWHMVVIFIWCGLFVTSQFDVIIVFPNQHFREVCWRSAYSSTRNLVILCVIALNTNYQRCKLGYRRNIHSKLRHSSSSLKKYQAAR